MIKIRTENSEIKHGAVGERKKVNETKNCFFEGIDKIDIPLLKLIRKNKTQIKNIKIFCIQASYLNFLSLEMSCPSTFRCRKCAFHRRLSFLAFRETEKWVKVFLLHW